jgi:hypothetical protein
MSILRVFNFRIIIFLMGISLGRLALADLPLQHLPPGIQQLAALPDEALEDLFRNGSVPAAIAEGRALGYHRLSRETLDRAPWTHMLAVKTIWQAKTFVKSGEQVVMVDDTILPHGLEPLKAHVLIASAADILQERYPKQIEQHTKATLDDKPSLITDYFTWQYPPLLQPVMQQFRPWLDEYRVIDPSQPGLWLGRSLYAGQFWCWLIIEFEEND